MSPEFDLRPAAARLGALVSAVRDDQLTLPTPCPDYAVGDLLDHIDGLSLAFTWAATKEFPDGPTGGARGDASRLGDDWRARIPTRLGALAAAWQDPAAWSGMTKAGPIDMPGEIAALVAADEVVAHGWDLARATGQPFDADADVVAAATAFAGMFTPEDRGDAFAAPVETSADASPLDRLIGLVGRDPAWTAA